MEKKAAVEQQSGLWYSNTQINTQIQEEAAPSHLPGSVRASAQPQTRDCWCCATSTARGGSFSLGGWFLCPLSVKATLFRSIILCKIISRQLWGSFVKVSSTVSFEVQMRKPGRRNPSYRDSFVPPRSWNESKKCCFSQNHPGPKLQTIPWNLIHPLEAKFTLHFPILILTPQGPAWFWMMAGDCKASAKLISPKHISSFQIKLGIS